MTPFIGPHADPLAAFLIGNSAVMNRLRALIHRVGPSRLPVFITGPTGSGKELVASALHRVSQRKGAYVAFNVCAVAETMFEDALFVTRAARSLERLPMPRDIWPKQITALFFSTKLADCRWRRRPSYCAR